MTITITIKAERKELFNALIWKNAKLAAEDKPRAREMFWEVWNQMLQDYKFRKATIEVKAEIIRKQLRSRWLRRQKMLAKNAK